MQRQKTPLAYDMAVEIDINVGLLAEIEVTKHPDGRMEYTARAVPVWVALPGYRILPPEAADTMRLGDAYRTFRLDTDSLLAR